jgi:hypothetical protein
MPIFFLFSSIKSENRSVEPVLWGEERRFQWEEGRRTNTAQKICHKYANAKMVSVKTIPGMGGGGELSKIYLIHCKNFCKCHRAPQPHLAQQQKNWKIHLCPTIQYPLSNLGCHVLMSASSELAKYF